MKKRNKGKKALTAVGAVVAAGLTPGIIAATPGCLPGQNANVEITAADVVAIDGQVYGFDELYARQQPDSVETNVDLPEVQIQALPRGLKYGPLLGPQPRPKVVEVGTYKSVTQEPYFPGGEAALIKYIEDHIQYPPKAARAGIQGVVVVRFVVGSLGFVGDVEVVSSVRKDIDAEAVRVVKMLPRFSPARQHLKPVSVWYTLPITFSLPKENDIKP